MENILLKNFDTKHNTAPFERIELSHYKEAIENSINEAKENINDIILNKNDADFENTVEALEWSGDRLDRVASIFFNLNSAETSDEMQKLAQEISPMISAFSNDVALNEDLFKRVKQVFDKKESFKLSREQNKLLEKHYNSFVRNGALLNEDDKKTLRQIDDKLSRLTLTFQQNVLKETQDFILHITDENDLSGLPDSSIEGAKEEAESRSLDGWVFTLDYPSYIPFMTYADKRELRKKMSIAFGAKAFRNNEFDNREVIKEIVTLRHKRARLLGFKNHADYVLQERMAKSPKAVNEFLEDLLKKAKPAAEKEFDGLKNFAKELDGIEKIQKWDGAYYTEKLKQKLFNLDDEKLKPYFELDAVLNGVFEIANRLYGYSFKLVDDIQKYHPDVKTYEVYNKDGGFLAVFYADFHPRKGKRAGAWMTTFKDQYRKNGENSRPHVANVCNFTKPTKSKPSLLTFNEVTTLFHEFGHALHAMSAQTTYPSLSGASVYWDFVELPSQLLENWCYEQEALELFAKHYETGDLIPQDFIKKIKESSNFMEGLTTIRQISFGLLDMAYHANENVDLSNLKKLEKETMEVANLYPDVPENMMSTQFAHIFAGGYSSGYYSYKWAEVLDADAFAYFKENGIFNRDVANKFRENILEKGGTIDPMELYKNFRGSEPNVDALLERAGLLEKI